MLYKETECILTEQQMQGKLKYWKSILGLEHWEIKFQFKRQRDMEPKQQAYVSWVIPKASASIVMVCHDDYGNDLWLQDMEQSLVHELLHVKCAAFDSFEDGTLHDLMHEQYIDSMAKIIVTMDRERRGEHAGT
jgi:hypothetical protein